MAGTDLFRVAEFRPLPRLRSANRRQCGSPQLCSPSSSCGGGRRVSVTIERQRARQGRALSISAALRGQMIADKTAGLSIWTVELRTPDHTAVTVVVPLLLSGTATVSVVGMRPVEGGTCSLYVNEA